MLRKSLYLWGTSWLDFVGIAEVRWRMGRRFVRSAGRASRVRRPLQRLRLRPCLRHQLRLRRQLRLRLPFTLRLQFRLRLRRLRFVPRA
jgi:hypothetical protein